MKSLLAGLMVVVLSTFGLVTVSTGTAVADPYPGTVETTTTVKHRSSVRKTHRFSMKVTVSAAGATPTGTVTCKANRKKGGFQYTQSKAYSGSTVKFRTGKLRKLGRYSFTCTFVAPANSVFKGSSRSGSTKVRRGAS